MAEVDTAEVMIGRAVRTTRGTTADEARVMTLTDRAEAAGMRGNTEARPRREGDSFRAVVTSNRMASTSPPAAEDAAAVTAVPE